jgi:hypothetical protein
VPENYCGSKPFNNTAILIPSNNTVAGITKVYPPSVCGQTVVDCVESFYTDHGWLSVGLTMASMIAPEIPLGAIGGCMLFCALNGPTNYVTPC